MTESATLRVGIVGAGGMARVHLAAWQQLGAAVRFGGRTPEALAEMLATSDVIDICTPTDTHHELASAALAAGRHVICEKPLALTAEEALDIAARARAANRQLHVAHVVRYFAAYAAAHAAVRDGLIGTPTEVWLSRIGAAPTAGWFLDEARSGGVLMDQLIHDFDYARWLSGDVVSIRAEVAAHAARRSAHYVTAEATLQHANGAVSHLAGGWLEPDTPFTTTFSIAGPGGTLTHSSSGGVPGAVVLTRPGAAPEELLSADAVAADQPFVSQLGDVAAAIAGQTGAQSRITVDDAVAAVELTLAARRSAASGRPERVRRF